jgi:DNA repair protein RadC
MENTKETRLYRVAEIALTYKSNVKPSQRPKITESRDAYYVLFENRDKTTLELQEQIKVMFMNRADKVRL